MSILNLINTISILVCLSGCGGAIAVPNDAPAETETAQVNPGVSPTPVTTANPIPAPANLVLPVVDAASPSNIALTYYTVTNSVAPVTGFPSKTIAMKGSCVVYLTKTYCWDNGVQEIDTTVSHLTSQFYYTFFSIGSVNQSFGECYGGCHYDLMSQPTYVDTRVTNTINQSVNVDHEAQATPATVLSTGVATSVNCAAANGVLNCTDFAIDTNQVAL